MATPQLFRVDPTATFEMVSLLQVVPKTAFRSTVQETTKDGLPKWEGQFTCGFQAFGRTEFSILKVGFAGPRNPGDGIAPGTPVNIVGLEVGVMDKTITDKTTGETKTVGAQVWFRAEGVASIAASNGRGKAQAAEAA